MTSDLFVTVNGTDTIFENSDFIVDTTAGTIKPVDTLVTVAEKNSGVLLVYPNPVASQFTVSFARLKWKPTLVELWNMEGQLVIRKEEVVDDRMLLERNRLPSGMYLLRIICEEGILKEKLLFH